MSQREPGAADPIDAKRQMLIKFFNNFPFNQLLGMQILDVEPGRARLSLNWRPDLCQPAGILHGGIIASLIDTAIAHAIMLTLDEEESPTAEGRLVSVDLRIKYLRPVSEGEIFCDAHIVRPGRQIIHTAATVTNAEGKQVALGDSIYMKVSSDRLKKEK